MAELEPRSQQSHPQGLLSQPGKRLEDHMVRHVVDIIFKRRKGPGPTRPPSQPGTEPPEASKEFPVPWPSMADVAQQVSDRHVSGCG